MSWDASSFVACGQMQPRVRSPSHLTIRKATYGTRWNREHRGSQAGKGKTILCNRHVVVERRTAREVAALRMRVAMGVVSQEQTMDAKEHVKRDLLYVFRTYKAQTLSLHFGPLETHIRGYNTRWKEALQAAI